MNQKKFQKLSVVALIISLLPLVTFIPVLLHITLTDGVRSEKMMQPYPVLVPVSHCRM